MTPALGPLPFELSLLSSFGSREPVLVVDWVGDDVVVVVSDDIVVVVSGEVDSVMIDSVAVVDSEGAALVRFTSTAKEMSATLSADIVRCTHFDTAC
jgi:hypothetical protein